jgi:hypothetical protein
MIAASMSVEATCSRAFVPESRYGHPWPDFGMEHKDCFDAALYSYASMRLPKRVQHDGWG